MTFDLTLTGISTGSTEATNIDYSVDEDPDQDGTFENTKTTSAFNLEDTTAPTVVINSVSPSSVGQYGTVTVDYNLTDAGTGVDTSSSDTALELADSDGDVIVNNSLTTGTNQQATFDLTNLAGGEAAAGTLTLKLNGTDSDSITSPETATTTDTSASVTGVGSNNRALNNDGTGTFDTEDGTGVIFDGATVFQGEQDIEFQGSTSSLTGTAGDSEGQTLQLPVSETETTGTYDGNGPTDGAGGFEVTVLEPRITLFEVLNSNEEDIAGGSVPEGETDVSGSGDLTVDAHYNYEQAEDLELTIENEDGLEVTGDALADRGAGNEIKSSTDGELEYELDFTGLGTGTYTIEVAGSDDLDFGSAIESTTVTVTGDDDITVDLDEDTATRGNDVTYTIRGSNAGATHVVLIDNDDFRDGITNDSAQSTFRNVGDTDETGIVTDSGTVVPRDQDVSVQAPGESIDYAYANVTIDDDTGVGAGQVDTSNLDTTDVDVELYDETVINPIADGTDNEDDPTLTVEEGTVGLNTPSGTYVVGSEITINGTASEGVDDVALYTRRDGDYQIVDLDSTEGDGVSDRSISVDADDTFEQEDAVISRGDGGGNDILSLPGSYRLGVIDVADVQDSNGNPVDTVDVSDFNTGTSSQGSIRVVDTELNANVKSVGGQVASEDGDINVSGVALGNQEVDVVFFDERGNANHETISVDDDNTFDEDEVNLGGLDTGQVSIHVLSTGRDGAYGDGEFPDNNGIADFVENNLSGQGLTGDQMRARLLDQTVEEVASDDRIVTETFRLADSSTAVGDVYPEGAEASGINPIAVDDTMVVEGTTNLRPDDNSITVELNTQAGDSVALSTTDEWGYDGQWSLTLELEDIQTGTYDLEADDSFNEDVESVEIVQQRQTATPEPTDTPEPTATDTPEPDTATDTPEPTATDTPEPDTATATPTEEGGPGFGAVIAVIALLAAALLATRRDT
ncbi:HVO_2072 family ArtA-dependent S-layer glycoprotein [Haloplanus sp.]|uniref:HVO_2072 family ArtA-dependent S-layer glycoprotein n=1 Tax=Haloplanus sp. TaxID=1961696 RepID=UPI0026147CBD|nr:HVO_2072 family ArtA-dependent S-layer glycoprotein [Haloplanus sp.]